MEKRQLTDEQRSILRQCLWDLNLTPEDFLAIIEGRLVKKWPDGAIEAFKDSPFYLTGGTTLSRGYYNHRFSDDLDYFLNGHPDFPVVAERCIKNLSMRFAMHIVKGTL